ncbi:MAG: hypothetical protein HN704_06145 [Bacteroidetes bacterium]|jgi:hypothetical protein|nr:hypothetical protein [Bacteroidota bacterium]MBT6686139.1 hypothetical protein [Bacteroidota bacterium]MBT7145110.1 hypothetical protein [Bacteroidota bacterium]MBT7491168.1 hypothetical protein [Bacteroidota bacterium]
MKLNILLFLLVIGGFKCIAQQTEKLTSFVLIVQPIIVQSDEGTDPASMALPENLVDYAYSKAEVDFHFLEPINFNNTKARDGYINLDSIVRIANKEGYLKGQNDIVNMFFVNAVDGHKGPLGRGMMGGNITFIALGNDSVKSNENLEAFVIAHEVGHNLSLTHAIDDENVPDSVPNIQGDGDFEDRINPKYSLNQYQIDIVQKSPLVHPRVDFLNTERAAKAILDESYEPYFSQLQIREIEAFTNSEVTTTNLDKAHEYAKEKFALAVTDFSEREKKCISFVVDKITAILLENDIGLMAYQPWRFIKVKNWLCGGFAHTRGTYIILSQRHIDHLSETWNDNMTAEEERILLEKMGALLVHEQMHSLQRTFKSKFENLYTEYWNFTKAHVLNDSIIRKDQVSNPDAPIAEWLIANPKDANSFYWVRTLFKETEGIPVMGKDFADKVFVVKKINGKFSTVKSENSNLVYTNLDSIDFYTNAFPTSRGIDHPNEISAYMFSDYFKSLFSNTKPFNETNGKSLKNSDLFIQWIKKEMK